MLILLTIYMFWWLYTIISEPIFVNSTKIPAVAITIAPFVILNPKYVSAKVPPELLAHELQHIKQYKILSPLVFVVLYLLFSGVLWIYFFIITGSVSEAFWNCYWYNPFEINARKVEKKGGVNNG